MELKVQVSDEEFEKVIRDGLHSLSQDEIKDIVKEALKSFLKEKQNLTSSILFEKSYYGSINDYKLTNAGKDIVEQCISENDFSDLKSAIIENIKAHGNEIIVDALIQAFFRQLANSNEIQKAIFDAAAGFSEEIKAKLKNKGIDIDNF